MSVSLSSISAAASTASGVSVVDATLTSLTASSVHFSLPPLAPSPADQFAQAFRIESMQLPIDAVLLFQNLHLPAQNPVQFSQFKVLPFEVLGVVRDGCGAHYAHHTTTAPFLVQFFRGISGLLPQ